jgi:hypothetical protein
VDRAAGAAARAKKYEHFAEELPRIMKGAGHD